MLIPHYILIGVFQGGVGVIASNPTGSQGIHASFPIVVLTELE